MKSVFVLQHSYELDSCEETKFIGVYTSKEEAQAAIERLKTQNGFRQKPNNFYIDEYELNKDHWTEDFATITTIYTKDFQNNWKAVVAEILEDETYQILEFYENDLLGDFKNLDIVKCKKHKGRLCAIELVKRNDKNN